MEYVVKAKNRSDWSNVAAADVKTTNWDGYSYRPHCTARLEYIRNKGFQVQLVCYESAPLARYKNFLDPVWTDSCMEFFVNFAPQNTNKYLNIEMNSAGGWLVGFGDGRYDRIVPEGFANYAKPPKAVVEQDRWSVTLFLELDLIKRIFGEFDPEDGYRFCGNFYKCGDQTPSPHYLSWSPVTTPRPEFHSPECFGTFIIQD